MDILTGKEKAGDTLQKLKIKLPSYFQFVYFNSNIHLQWFVAHNQNTPEYSALASTRRKQGLEATIAATI